MTGTLTGRGVLLWLIGFFGIIMAMNAWYITVSVRTFRGEDEQLPYLQGITFNQTLARRAEQRSLGWQAGITVTRPLPGSVRLRLEVRDHQGHPVDGLDLSGVLRHPADENRDHSLALRPMGRGIYEADAGNVASGAWDVLVRDTGRPFEAERRLWVP